MEIIKIDVTATAAPIRAIVRYRDGTEKRFYAYPTAQEIGNWSDVVSITTNDVVSSTELALGEAD